MKGTTEKERERDRQTESTKTPVGRTGFVREDELVMSQREGEIMNDLFGVGLSRMDGKGERAASAGSAAAAAASPLAICPSIRTSG